MSKDVKRILFLEEHSKQTKDISIRPNHWQRPTALPTVPTTPTTLRPCPFGSQRGADEEADGEAILLWDTHHEGQRPHGIGHDLGVYGSKTQPTQVCTECSAPHLEENTWAEDASLPYSTHTAS